MEEKYHKKPKDKDKDKKKPKMKEEVAKDTYDNPGEAAARAKEIGCTGIHTNLKTKKKMTMIVIVVLKMKNVYVSILTMMN